MSSWQSTKYHLGFQWSWNLQININLHSKWQLFTQNKWKNDFYNTNLNTHTPATINSFLETDNTHTLQKFNILSLHIVCWFKIILSCHSSKMNLCGDLGLLLHFIWAVAHHSQNAASFLSVWSSQLYIYLLFTVRR